MDYQFSLIDVISSLCAIISFYGPQKSDPKLFAPLMSLDTRP